MIKVENLTKRYAGQPAIQDLSFEVSQGEIMGFLGPNGAGKTTTMRILAGFMPPTSGRATVAGFDVFEQSLQARAHLGYMPENVPLYSDMRVTEYLNYRAALKGVQHRRVAERVGDVEELCGLKDVKKKLIGTLSKGYRQRVGLADALLAEPDLLILDEPTIGLDVVAKQRVRDFLIEINRERGVTVLLTTHDLGDIERLCKRLLVIDHGSLIWDGGIDELRERYGAERTLIVDLEEPEPPLQIEGARVEKVDGPRQWLRFRGPAADLTARVAAATRLVDLQLTEPDIEEIVRRIYSAGQSDA